MPPLENKYRWLLDRAAQFAVPVRLLLPEDVDQVQQWNCPSPPWHSDELFAALRYLESIGWIEFRSYPERGPVEGVIIPSPALTEQGLRRDYSHGPTLAFRFTMVGGETWEDLVRPKWHLTYKSDLEMETRGDTRQCVVTASNEDSVRRAFLLTACSQNLLVVPGTEQYTASGPWQPTYWKTVDSGVRLVAVVGDYTSEIRLENMLPPAAQRYYAESRRVLDHWFEPIDEPRWQQPLE